MKYSRVALLHAALFILMVGHASAFTQSSNRRACVSHIARNKSGDIDPVYFPQNIFSESTIKWYSKHLSAMKEPPLYSLINCQVESYRFLWLRTFHAPVVVRLWQIDGHEFLLTKKLSGQGGYDPGKLVINKIRPLTQAEWKKFNRLLNNMSYWELPTDEEEPPPVIDSEGRESITVHSDGAQWIVEGISKGRYHVVDRWSAKGAYREAGLYLLGLSGLKIKRNEIY